MVELPIDVWSDVACPWCYIGKRRLEAALAGFEHAGQVAVRWHAFELDPSAPASVDSSVSYAERLGRKYRVPAAQAQKMIDRMVETAAADGLDFRFDIIRPGNTFDAHRLIAHAGEVGLQDAVKERFMRAYLCEGELMSDPRVLARLAAEAGVDAARAEAILDGDDYAAKVRAEEMAAHTMSVTGVPFFLVAQRFGVPGAQPVETMARVLDTVWGQVTEDDELAADGATCGPDRC